MRNSLLFLACTVPLFTAQTETTREEIVRQLRWPLEENSPLTSSTRETSRTPAHRRVEKLLGNGTFSVSAGAKAVEQLRNLMADAPANSMVHITPEGAVPGEAREKLLRIRDLAYEHALLYLASGEETEANQSKSILLRFADLLPEWPIYDRQQQRHPQDDLAYLQRWDANGLWGDWYPRDLACALPLLRAYDIIRPTLTPEEQHQIETRIFEYQKVFAERFNSSLYGNVDAHPLLALVVYSKVLRRPEWIHEAVRYWEDLNRYAYYPEGFWKEVSADYHQQITLRTADLFPSLLKGYSDPPGFRDLKDDLRYDQLDLQRTHSVRLQRMRAAVDVLALPDGNCLSINDAWPKAVRAPSGPSDKPGLLGTAGLAKLGTGGMVAFLKYTGIRGHDHRDALGLSWFAAGREVFSETGYQPISGSRSTRQWNSATASHLTAAIDETEHYSSRQPVLIPAPIPGSGFHSITPKTARPPGAWPPLEAASPAAARFFNQGRLKFWSASRNDVQAMEVDSANAYPGLASIFRRTIVMVPLASGEGYLVDIFRIRGGKLHDYFLRGGLDEPYTMEFNVPLQARPETTLYSMIRVTSEAALNGPLEATTRYEDGLSVRSIFAGSGGTRAREELLLGEAPAIRRNAEAPFSFVRRTGPETGGPLESCFVWVHEASRGTPRIREVRLEQHGMDLLLTIERDSGTDYVLSGVSDDSLVKAEGWHFQGRLAYASLAGGKMTGTVFQGGPLVYRQETVTEANRPLAGEVLSTARKDNGDAEDSALVEMEASALTDDTLARLRTAHFDLTDLFRISIPIRQARREGSRIRLVLEHTPGFTVGQGESVMTEFPGWRSSQIPRVELETAPPSSSP